LWPWPFGWSFVLRVGQAHILVSDLAVRAANGDQAAHSVQTS